MRVVVLMTWLVAAVTMVTGQRLLTYNGKGRPMCDRREDGTESMGDICTVVVIRVEG